VRSGAGSIKRIVAMVMYVALTALAITGWGPSSGPMYFQIRSLVVLVSVVAFVLLFSNDLKRAFSYLFHRETGESSHQLGFPPGQSALPHVTSEPVNNPGQRSRNTAEMVRPPSITEHTTELLDKDPS